jgi:DNA-binding NarL/FixJ family response regulator
MMMSVTKSCANCVPPHGLRKYSSTEERLVLVSTVRVLVVDDHRPFRQFICTTLGKRVELQVVGQASDGLEAVEKADELRPDLIVLDIGLPRLSGIEAARRIRKLSAESRIIFVSQESSADVVQEALRLGGRGYVVKAHAGRELLAAVDAVCQGRQFVGSGLLAHDFSEFMDFQPDDTCLREAPPELQPRKGKGTRSHEVQFYSDDESFLDGFSRYTQAALLNGNAVIVVATEEHQKGLYQRLQERGGEIEVAVEQGRCTLIDVTETLSAFMVNDRPDPVRFLSVVGDLIAAARATAGGQSRVAICGECASILWAHGNADGAIQVERLCNQLTKLYEMDILCGFSLGSFCREEDKQIFQRICAGE